jgi:hypothetical protein
VITNDRSAVLWLTPLLRIAAVLSALFTFLGISLAGGGSTLSFQIPGPSLLVLAAMPTAAIQRSRSLFLAALATIAVGSSATIHAIMAYGEVVLNAIDLVLFSLFLLAFVVARKAATLQAGG